MSIDRQHRFSVNVWAGIVGQHLIGPYFFEGILTGAVYLRFLQTELETLLENVPLNIIRRLWYMHDGAPPHYSNDVRRYLDNVFRNKWIGRGGPVGWPPRSPDLNCLDFFLWGTIKDFVYQETPRNFGDLKRRIRLAFQAVNRNMLVNVQQAFRERIALCVENNGRNVDHL